MVSAISTLGDKLRAFRSELRLSQVLFAEKIGMSARTYQDIELGKTERLEAGVLDRLAKMGVDLAALVSRETSGLRATKNIAEPAPDQQTKPDHEPTAASLQRLASELGDDLATVSPPELRRVELVLLELGAFCRRHVLKQPHLADTIESAAEHFQEEVKEAARAPARRKRGDRAAS